LIWEGIDRGLPSLEIPQVEFRYQAPLDAVNDKIGKGEDVLARDQCDTRDGILEILQGILLVSGLAHDSLRQAVKVPAQLHTLTQLDFDARTLMPIVLRGQDAWPRSVVTKIAILTYGSISHIVES
jgi:hypothetical protein